MGFCLSASKYTIYLFTLFENVLLRMAPFLRSKPSRLQMVCVLPREEGWRPEEQGLVCCRINVGCGDRVYFDGWGLKFF
jgi:hypothetical protein